MHEQQADETMRLLRRMFTADGVAGYGPGSGAGVICPFCPAEAQASYIHSRVVVVAGNDNYDANGEYGLDVRGDVQAIEFENETCSHRWALAFGFHKGATFVAVKRLPDVSSEDDTDEGAGDELGRRRFQRRWQGSGPK